MQVGTERDFRTDTYVETTANMNAKRQRSNWLLDAALLSGFLLAMLLDLTGLGIHQWLGIAVPVLAGYHLIRHWQLYAIISAGTF